MAEYRELPMVLGSLKRSLRSQTQEQIVAKVPPQYTLNKGHVSFFYTKQQYLIRRFNDLCAELRHREYNIKPEERSIDFEIFPMTFRDDWVATMRDHHINLERIMLRISEKPDWYKMHGEPLDVRRYNQTIQDHYKYAPDKIDDTKGTHFAAKQRN